MLEKLPVPLGIVADLSMFFVDERKRVSNSIELRDFIKRWKFLWEIGSTQEEKDLASEDYELEWVYSCFIQNTPEKDWGWIEISKKYNGKG